MKETRYPGNFNPTIETFKNQMEAKNEIPRRACLWQFVPAEKAIYDAVGIIEAMGAHTLLTEAQCLLMDAQRKIADYVDNVLPTATDKRINPPINTYFDEVKLKGSPKTYLDNYFDDLLKTGSF